MQKYIIHSRTIIHHCHPYLVICLKTYNYFCGDNLSDELISTSYMHANQICNVVAPIQMQDATVFRVDTVPPSTAFAGLADCNCSLVTLIFQREWGTVKIAIVLSKQKINFGENYEDIKLVPGLDQGGGGQIGMHPI